MKPSFSQVSYYFGVLLAGFLINPAWVIFVPTQPFSDFLYYHQLAQQIAKGGKSIKQIRLKLYLSACQSWLCLNREHLESILFIK